MIESATDLDEIQQELERALAPRLQVLRPIGRGAMGAVFLARDPALKRHVVIKVLAPELADHATARERFAREAEMAAAVSHPNVVNVYHVDELPVSRTGYFIMQYVDGPTLAEACPLGTRASQARARRIAGEVASALAAAHAQGLVHRDIKPSNIMLEGLAERVVVVDFGISAAASPERRSALTRLTEQGTSLGTPAYMSPEQALGGEVTDKSDVYSLGVVAFELLTGRSPFEAQTALALVAAHAKDSAPGVASLRPELEPPFVALVDRMLAKDPSARPSAAEVARALLPSGAVTIEWPPPGLEPMLGRGAQALRWFTTAYAAATVALWLASSASGLSPNQMFGAFAATLISVALLVAGAIALGIATRRLRDGVQRGYPLGVVLDVALDSSPETAAMLNASGAHASISRERVMRFLILRRLAGASLLVGSCVSGVVITLWAIGMLRLSNRETADLLSGAGFVAFVAPLTLAVVLALCLGTPERRARSRDRVEMRTRLPSVASELVAGWLTSASLPAPTRRGALASRLSVSGAEWVASLLVILATVSIVSATVASIVGAGDLSQRLRPGRPADWAGEARRAAALGSALDSLLGRSSVVPSSPVDLAAARSLIASRRVSAVDVSQVWDVLRSSQPSIPAGARAAFDSASRRPSTDAFRRLASGTPLPVMWYSSETPADSRARFNAALSDSRPIRLSALAPIAVDQAAASALSLTRGDRADAVRRAREILSVARMLIRDPLPNAHRQGVGMAGIGARVLEEIGGATGDGALMREGLQLEHAIEARRALQSAVSIRSLMSIAVLPGDTTLLAIASTRKLLPVDRWAAVDAIAHGACWNAAEVRVGSAPARRERLRAAADRIDDIDHSPAWIAFHLRFLEDFDRGAFSDTALFPLPPVIGRMTPFVRSAICGVNH